MNTGNQMITDTGTTIEPLTITTREVLETTGFSRSTLTRQEANNGFPKATVARGMYSRKAVYDWLRENGLM